MSQQPKPTDKAEAEQAKRLAKLQIKSCLTFNKPPWPCLMHIPTRKCIRREPGWNNGVWIMRMNEFIADVEKKNLDKYDTR